MRGPLSVSFRALALARASPRLDRSRPRSRSPIPSLPAAGRGRGPGRHILGAVATSAARSYEEACATHRWHVPERYNIATDVCDKHPRDKLAMVWEDWRGNERSRRAGASSRTLRRKFANVLREHGVERGDRVAMLLPATPETAAVFFGTWKAGAILLSMSVLYGDEGIRHRIKDSQAKVLVTDADNADRVDRGLVEDVLILDDACSPTRRRLRDRRHGRRRSGQLYYSSGTTGLAKGILHAHRYVLAHEEFVYCHDVRDGEFSTAWASGRGPPGSRRCSGRGGWARRSSSSSARAASTPSSSSPCCRSTADERLHDPHGDAVDDGRRRRRQAVPAAVPHRLLRGRAAEPRGDPLVPRPVRHHGARLLRPHRVVSAVRELPVHGGARGLDGTADARLGRADPRRGRAAGRAAASAARSACGRDPTRITRSATGTAPRRRRRPSAASGSTPRTRPSRTRTATSGTPAAPTT